MDESPSGAMNFANSIAVTDEEKEKAVEEYLHKSIGEEQCRENSSVVEANTYIEEIKKLKPLFDISPVAAMGSDRSEWESFLKQRNEVHSRDEERHIHCFKIPSASYLKPFIRRKVKQEEIVFNRECRKLEKVWTNRGLPADQETVSSAASKDAFDLKDLSKSLPSTSSSVIKQSDKGCQTAPRSLFAQMREKIARAKMINEYLYQPHPLKCYEPDMTERLPAYEAIASVRNSLRATLARERKDVGALARARSLARLKMFRKSVPFVQNKEPESDEEEEVSEVSALLMAGRVRLEGTQPKKDLLSSKTLSQWKPLPSLEQPNFGSKFAQMSIDDKQDEKEEGKQNSNAEKHLPISKLKPLPPLLSNYVSKLPSFRELDNWTAEIGLSDIPAPFNSPTKKENADKDDTWQSMEKLLIRQRMAVRLCREKNKLKTLNSLRMLPEDEDSFEDEIPPPEEASRISTHVPILDSAVETQRSGMDRMKGYMQFIRDMKRSIKNVRTSQCPRRILKSDKVVPD